MNNRQKRLCRALLDFYDESGAEPYPLALLAKKTGIHVSDIYDRDSQSGDIWPFDPKARGKFAGLLSFSPGKNPTVSITSAGLVTLENLCNAAQPAAVPAKAIDTPILVPAPTPAPSIAPPAKSVSVPPHRTPVSTPPQRTPVSAPAQPTPVPTPAPYRSPVSAKPFPPTAKNIQSTSYPFPVPTPIISPRTRSLASSNLVEARARFKGWLEFDPEGKAMTAELNGPDLVEAAFNKFFSEFLRSRDS